jgi:Predicted integral membrane protein
MPYVEGPSLRDRLRNEVPFPVEEAVRLAREVALALDHAHRRGVVHRDINHLWSERYDRELSDVFAIQDEITASIVGALRLVLSVSERQALAAERADVRAYEYYLRGRELANQVRREGYQAALRMYQRAVEIDPGYVRAFAGIADCHSWMYMYYEATEENLRRADEASRRALELGANSAEAHASRGFALSLGKHYEEARAELAAAIGLAPSLYEGHYLFGRVCWAEGRWEEARRHFEAGDASSAFYNLGCFYAIGGDVQGAFDCLNRAVDLGYGHREWIEHDADLDSLHGDPRCRALIGRFGGPTRE